MSSGEKICVLSFLIFILSFVGSVTAYNIHANNVIAEMVANGADPIAASCAINGFSNSEILCSGKQ